MPDPDLIKPTSGAPFAGPPAQTSGIINPIVDALNKIKNGPKTPRGTLAEIPVANGAPTAGSGTPVMTGDPPNNATWRLIGNKFAGGAASPAALSVGGGGVTVSNLYISSADPIASDRGIRIACTLGQDIDPIPTGAAYLVMVVDKVGSDLWEVVVSDGIFSPTAPQGPGGRLGEFLGNTVVYRAALQINPTTGLIEIIVPIIALNKIRSFGLRNAAWVDDASIPPDTKGVQDTTITPAIKSARIKRANEIEYTLATEKAGEVIPADFSPTVPHDRYLPAIPGAAGLVDLRPGYRGVYGLWGKRHIREAQTAGFEDGSADASPLLEKIILSCEEGDYLDLTPDAKYLTTSSLDITGLRGVEIVGNGASFFKNTPDIVGLVRFEDCLNTKVHDFHLYGYYEKAYTGSQWLAVPGAGNPTISGTTMVFNTIGDTAQLNSTSFPTEGEFLARNVDGDVVGKFTLQGTGDAQIQLVRAWDGRILGTKTVTVTGTTTEYTVKIPNLSVLHELLQWRIKKLTAGGSFTLFTSTVVGPRGPSGGGTYENQVGLSMVGRLNGFEAYDFTVEGTPSYGWWVYTDNQYGQDIRLHNFQCRVVTVQGIAVSRARGPIYLHEFEVSEVGGHGFDIEVNSAGNFIQDVYTTDFSIGNCSGTALVNETGTFSTFNCVTSNGRIWKCGSVAGFGWGSLGGSTTHLRCTDIANIGAGSFVIMGENHFVGDIESPGGFRFFQEVRGPQDTTIFEGGNDNDYHEHGHNTVKGWVILGGPNGPSGEFVINDGGVGTNKWSDVSYRTAKPIDPTSVISGPVKALAGEVHETDVSPFRRLAPFSFPSSDVSSDNWTAGGQRAYGEPVYDVMSIAGPSTPVTWMNGVNVTNDGAGPEFDVGVGGFADFLIDILSGPRDQPIPGGPLTGVRVNDGGAGNIEFDPAATPSRNKRAYQYNFLTPTGESLSFGGIRGPSGVNVEKFDATHRSADITIPSPLPAGVTGVNIYRTKYEAPQKPYSRLATNFNPASPGWPTFRDTLSDTALGIQIDLPTIEFRAEGAITTGGPYFVMCRWPEHLLDQEFPARVLMGPFRYIRLAWHITFPPTYNFIARGFYGPVGGSNLRRIRLAVPGSVTAMPGNGVIFPTYPYKSNFAWQSGTSPDTRVDRSGLKFYRPAMRPPHRGPVPPAAAVQATLASGPSGNAVTIAPNNAQQLAAGGWITHALTLFRSSDTGAGNDNARSYTERCDIIPTTADAFVGLILGGGTSSLRDLGDRVEIYTVPGNTPPWGLAEQYPWVSMPAITGSQLNSHDESGWEPDTNYGVWPSGSWPTTFGWGTKRVDGHPLSFGSQSPPGGAEVDLWYSR